MTEICPQWIKWLDPKATRHGFRSKKMILVSLNRPYPKCLYLYSDLSISIINDSQEGVKSIFPWNNMNFHYETLICSWAIVGLGQLGPNTNQGFIMKIHIVPRKDYKKHNKLYDVVHQNKATSCSISILRDGCCLMTWVSFFFQTDYK